MKCVHSISALFAWSFLLLPKVLAQDSTKALAILQRVADVRLETPDFSVELEREFVGEGVRYYQMHVLGDKLRVDEFTSPDFNRSSRTQTTLIVGDEAYHFLDSPHQSLEKTTRSNVHTAGSSAFTPRQIGLAAVPSLEDDYPTFLYKDADKITLLSSEEWEGVPVEHVEVERYFVVLSTRVNVESGRVYQRIFFLKHEGNREEHTRVVSKFSDDSKIPWMPTEVTLTYHSIGKVEIIRNIRVTSTSPSPKLFELASLGIPKETTVVDRELLRAIGTWDGKEIVPYEGYGNEQMPEERSLPMYLLVGAVGTLLLCVVIFRFVRSRT